MSSSAMLAAPAWAQPVGKSGLRAHRCEARAPSNRGWAPGTRRDSRPARVGTNASTRRQLTRSVRAAAKQDGEPGAVSADGDMKSRKKERKPTGELLSGMWQELKLATKPLKEDDLSEAIDLLATLDAARARPQPGEQWDDARWKEQELAAEQVGEKVGSYWGAKWDKLVNSDAVKDAAPLVTGAVNVAIAGVLLRLALPRIAALQAVGGFDELAEFFNLPPRAELSGYLDQLQGLNVGLVFAVYFGLFAAEKLTMTDEFLPIGFILPVVSPAVFGGVLGGTFFTSLASTMAASLNFWLGRTVLREKALGLKWKDNPTVGESKWFQALSRRFDSTQFPESEWPLTEGFKSALLLRLCPILPIPLSGNWYVCGMTPLKFPEFFAAHFIGSSKTAFVDAYLGSLLLQAAFESDAMKEQAQTVLVFETVVLVLISVGVTTYATDLFSQILEEEGIDASDMMMSLDEIGEESETEKRAKAEVREEQDEGALWAAEAATSAKLEAEGKKGEYSDKEKRILSAMDQAAAASLAALDEDSRK